MSLRTFRERCLQVGAYEFVGLAVAAPLYGVFFDGGAGEGAFLIIVLFLPEVLWSMAHNWAFDHAEWRACRRVASRRPHRWRILHAMTHEAGSTVVTLPVIMLVTGQGVWGALVIDLWLGAFYAVYAYLFHLGYDRLRPVPAPEVVTVVRGRAVHLSGPVGAAGSARDQRGAGAAIQQLPHDFGQRGRQGDPRLEVKPADKTRVGAGEPADAGIGRIGRTGEVGIIDRDKVGGQEIAERVEQDARLVLGRGPAERALRRGAHPLDLDRDEKVVLQLDRALHGGARVIGRAEVEGQRVGGHRRGAERK